MLSAVQLEGIEATKLTIIAGSTLLTKHEYTNIDMPRPFEVIY